MNKIGANMNKIGANMNKIGAVNKIVPVNKIGAVQMSGKECLRDLTISIVRDVRPGMV